MDAASMENGVNGNDGGIADIFPEPGTVKIDGELIEIIPLRIKQIGAFSRAIRPLAGDIGRLLGKSEQLDSMETTDFICAWSPRMPTR